MVVESRMTYWQRLWRVELLGIASLCVLAGAVAVMFALDNEFISPGGYDLIEVLVLSSALTIVYGIVPVTLFGAPIYSALIASPKFNLPLMLVISTVPGFVFLFFHTVLGVFGVVGGAVVFYLTHIAFKRWVFRPRSDIAS